MKYICSECLPSLAHRREHPHMVIALEIEKKLEGIDPSNLFHAFVY